jgi:hypothetical protein
MAHNAASRFQLDVETYLAGTLSMVAYPSDFEFVSQVLAPATEYFSVLVDQSQAVRTQDANEAQIELEIKLRLLYRFTTNEAEYTGSASTPLKHKAAMAIFMDEKWWRGKGGSFTLTPPLDVQDMVELPEATITRSGRVIETVITVTLVTTSV